MLIPKNPILSGLYNGVSLAFMSLFVYQFQKDKALIAGLVR